MELNKKLFYELCNKYGIEFSNEYDTIMVERNDTIEPLTDENLEEILFV